MQRARDVCPEENLTPQLKEYMNRVLVTACDQTCKQVFRNIVDIFDSIL